MAPCAAGLPRAPSPSPLGPGPPPHPRPPPLVGSGAGSGLSGSSRTCGHPIQRGSWPVRLSPGPDGRPAQPTGPAGVQTAPSPPPAAGPSASPVPYPAPCFLRLTRMYAPNLTRRIPCAAPPRTRSGYVPWAPRPRCAPPPGSWPPVPASRPRHCTTLRRAALIAGSAFAQRGAAPTGATAPWKATLAASQLTCASNPRLKTHTGIPRIHPPNAACAGPQGARSVFPSRLSARVQASQGRCSPQCTTGCSVGLDRSR